MALSIGRPVIALASLVFVAACGLASTTVAPQALPDAPAIPLTWGDAGESPKEGYRLTFAEYDATRVGWTDISWSGSPNIWGRRGQLQQRMYLRLSRMETPLWDLLCDDLAESGWGAMEKLADVVGGPRRRFTCEATPLHGDLGPWKTVLRADQAAHFTGDLYGPGLRIEVIGTSGWSPEQCAGLFECRYEIRVGAALLALIDLGRARVFFATTVPPQLRDVLAGATAALVLRGLLRDESR